MLSKRQIKLVHVAARAAGLITERSDARYRLLLAQYVRPNGQRATSCKELTNTQVSDLLAICESLGFRLPGKSETHYRGKIEKGETASYAQQSAIDHLRGDLGWGQRQIEGFCRRMTGGRVSRVARLNARQAYKVIEGLKAIVGRKTGKDYRTLRDIEKAMEAATDGEKDAHKVG